MRISDWSSDVCSSDLVKRFLDERGVEATVVEMNGAVELAPRLQIATFICDIVSTGATLEANGLRVVDSVLESEAVLIRTSKPLAPEKLEVCENLLRRIEGVLATKESKYIMRSEEHTSELQSLMRISYDVLCLKKKQKTTIYIYVSTSY